MLEANQKTMNTLYEADFYAWTQEQAKLLRSQQWELVDVENLIEEIEHYRIEREKANDKQAFCWREPGLHPKIQASQKSCKEKQCR